MFITNKKKEKSLFPKVLSSERQEYMKSIAEFENRKIIEKCINAHWKRNEMKRIEKKPEKRNFVEM